ncbi:MAG TPA: hypothetical protein VGH23_12950 [Rhizomicrobium sp.]|jgi:hypothetical protein
MIPRWQMIGFVALLAVAVALAIYASPNSYAHMFLTGRCLGQSMPAACYPQSAPRGGFGGARTTP